MWNEEGHQVWFHTLFEKLMEHDKINKISDEMKEKQVGPTPESNSNFKCISG